MPINVGAISGDLVGGLLCLARQMFDSFGESMILRQRVAGAEFVETALHFLIASRLAGLKLDATEPFRNFCDDVFKTQKVMPGTFQLALRLAPPRFVFAYPRGFLEDDASVVGAALKQAVNATLLYHRVGVNPHAGVHKQLADVFEPHGLPVQQVLAFTRTIELSSDFDLIQIEVHNRPVRVIPNQIDLSDTAPPPRARAVEDHVGHLAAAKRAGGLLAQPPSKRVDEIALAASVRPDDAGDARPEVEVDLIGEALEPQSSDAFKEHRFGYLRVPKSTSRP